MIVLEWVTSLYNIFKNLIILCTYFPDLFQKLFTISVGFYTQAYNVYGSEGRNNQTLIWRWGLTLPFIKGGRDLESHIESGLAHLLIYTWINYRMDLAVRWNLIVYIMYQSRSVINSAIVIWHWVWLINKFKISVLYRINCYYLLLLNSAFYLFFLKYIFFHRFNNNNFIEPIH